MDFGIVDSAVTDPMVHSGRHFGRTINAVINMRRLVNDGIRRQMTTRREGALLTDLPKEEQIEHETFIALVKMVPGLINRLSDASDEELDHRLTYLQLQKGVNAARADDTKGLKSAIIDWIAPPGQPLYPVLSRNNKIDRGFNHPRTGQMLCPAAWDWNDDNIKKELRSGQRKVPGEHWPTFVYEDYRYDPTEPWHGLFRGRLLVLAYKHIFTSPSSVDGENKATRSGNARIHGMSAVTLPSIAYVATQVRFALSSQSTFSRSDSVTDTERFYNSVMVLLRDKNELAEINELITWWNRQIFAGYVSEEPVAEDTPLAKIRERRERLNALAAASSTVLPGSGSETH
ncbi:hypothetical protein FIBSPDRAFT_760197 [Athelia psychrophila]|uniref:Uncharacterized protein n=1 Tax=Athelia psychrophila TaxID=1759441 RepID=A0A165Y7L8_9AGAM|nr:hypothetical protein FIBSPDRAFT_760197 [Fibularhizoctonia sp. CBS 109695]